jgi:hypothetical protein
MTRKIIQITVTDANDGGERAFFALCDDGVAFSYYGAGHPGKISDWVQIAPVPGGFVPDDMLEQRVRAARARGGTLPKHIIEVRDRYTGGAPMNTIPQEKRAAFLADLDALTPRVFWDHQTNRWVEEEEKGGATVRTPLLKDELQQIGEHP